jgi:four helix bundle protein
MENTYKIKSFTDLMAWKESHKLVLLTYESTRKFPNDELFCLTNQMRRASISVTSNIAEGFSRKSDKEKVQFYSVALGSLTELQSQLVIARDLGYLDSMMFKLIADQTVVVSKLVNGLAKSANFKHNT